jgi:hypothetical protein
MDKTLLYFDSLFDLLDDFFVIGWIVADQVLSSEEQQIDEIDCINGGCSLDVREEADFSKVLVFLFNN